MAASLDASKDDYACRHFGLSVLCFYLFFILVLSAQDVFTLINSRRYACLDVSPYVAFFEIYNGKVWTPGSAAPQTCRIYIFTHFNFNLNFKRCLVLSGLWLIEQQGSAACSGGWAAAGSGGRPAGSGRLRSGGRHQDHWNWQCLQVHRNAVK